MCEDEIQATENPAPPNSTLGVIIIGRNEGERLIRCFRSVSAAGDCVVYVDSASTDGSVAKAREAGAEVVTLDPSVPFCAARARNEGIERLMALHPDIRYVQCVDGDCEIISGWIERGIREFDTRPDLAAVCGRLMERFPDASIYNALCDLEWNKQVGEVDACGGIALYRADRFREVGGFDASVVAGEEPELCSRLRARGWKIVRLTEEMAWHDSAMLHFRQWWKRQVRGGYGALDVARRFEQLAGRGGGAFTRQVRSARTWVWGYPTMVILASLLGFCAAGPVAALLGGLAVAAILPLQMVRLAGRMLCRHVPLRVAVAYGVCTMVGKVAHVVGHSRYARDRVAGRAPQLIEHKAVAAPASVSAMRV